MNRSRILLSPRLIAAWTLFVGLQLQAALIAHEYPGPSEALVFLTEHERSLDDRHFGLRAYGEAWVNNWPASYLGRGANLSFADGHSEFWRWRDSRTLAIRSQGEAQPRNPDLVRLQAAVARPLP